MSTKLYWVEGPWPGKLALAARPRGGDWLEDEISAWRHAGIDAVLSLLTVEEQKELDLADESSRVKSAGMKFYFLPIPDRQPPLTESEVRKAAEEIGQTLEAGKNVLIYCRQGIGRSGLMAACLLITKGLSSGAAVESVTAARGTPVPETPEQRRWIDHYAASFADAK